MKWKVFEESKIELPEVIIGSMISGFSIATKNLVDIGIIEKSNMSRLTNDKFGTKFQFEVILLSKHLQDYSFTLFEFGYDVSLFPVKMYITKNIYEELVSRGVVITPIMTINDDLNFKSVIELIFDTKIFIEIVSGLMKIAARKIDDLPF